MLRKPNTENVGKGKLIYLPTFHRKSTVTASGIDEHVRFVSFFSFSPHRRTYLLIVESERKGRREKGRETSM